MTLRRPAASQYGTRLLAPTEPSMLAWRYGDGNSITGGNLDFTGFPWVFAFPGHGASPAVWLPSTLGNYGNLTNELTDRGNLVLSPDAGGGETWGGPSAMTALDSWYTWAVTTSGWANTCGILAWSMGGLDALNWARRNTSKVRAIVLLAPVTDLTWAHTGWAAEVEASYGGWPAAAGYDPITDAADYGWCPIDIYHGTSDATVPASQSSAFVTAVNESNVRYHPLTGRGHDLASSVSAYEIGNLLAA